MRFLHILGKFLISVGVGILLFVGWTLKGTDLYTNGQQDRLADEFASSPTLIPDEQGDGGGLRFVGPPKNFAPGPGDPVFRLVIPAIDTDHFVVEGVDVEELRKGPGHYPQCRPGFEGPLCTEFEEVFPGERGRVIVSGHRTTYAAPFWGVNKLKPGDEIRVMSKWGRFTYEVTRQEVVSPDSLAITVPSRKAELVLTTCNPRFSASERLIIYSELVETVT
jgi:sortase A